MYGECGNKIGIYIDVNGTVQEVHDRMMGVQYVQCNGYVEIQFVNSDGEVTESYVFYQQISSVDQLPWVSLEHAKIVKL